jgi:hypothetical protein
MTTVSADAAGVAVDLFRLDGKVALVTGASRGLGAAMAIALANAGAEVALHASEHPATATAHAIAQASGRRTETLAANLADRPAADRSIDGRYDLALRPSRHPDQQRGHHPAASCGRTRRRAVG